MTDMTVDIGSLYCPKNTPLRRLAGHFSEQGVQGDKVLDTLEDVGIYTFGQLLEYAKNNHFSDLPGIGAHTAEVIRQFIEFMENGNKGSLKVLIAELSKEIPNLRDVAEKHIRRRKQEKYSLLGDYS